jgi:hypothetical protein
MINYCDAARARIATLVGSWVPESCHYFLSSSIGTAIYYWPEKGGYLRFLRCLMKAIIVIFTMISALVMFSEAAPMQDEASANTPCGVVLQALKDMEHIEVGTTREVVEKYFKPDGGVQFPPNTRYTYRKCDYIKVKIDYRTSSSRESDFSPNDTVIKISKLYLEYPDRD